MGLESGTKKKGLDAGDSRPFSLEEVLSKLPTPRTRAEKADFVQPFKDALKERGGPAKTVGDQRAEDAKRSARTEKWRERYVAQNGLPPDTILTEALMHREKSKEKN